MLTGPLPPRHLTRSSLFTVSCLQPLSLYYRCIQINRIMPLIDDLYAGCQVWFPGRFTGGLVLPMCNHEFGDDHGLVNWRYRYNGNCHGSDFIYMREIWSQVHPALKVRHSTVQDPGKPWQKNLSARPDPDCPLRQVFSHRPVPRAAEKHHT